MTTIEVEATDKPSSTPNPHCDQQFRERGIESQRTTEEKESGREESDMEEEREREQEGVKPRKRR